MFGEVYACRFFCFAKKDRRRSDDYLRFCRTPEDLRTEYRWKGQKALEKLIEIKSPVVFLNVGMDWMGYAPKRLNTKKLLPNFLWWNFTSERSRIYLLQSKTAGWPIRWICYIDCQYGGTSQTYQYTQKNLQFLTQRKEYQDVQTNCHWMQRREIRPLG